jgi:hypothetical protein
MRNFFTLSYRSGATIWFASGRFCLALLIRIEQVCSEAGASRWNYEPKIFGEDGVGCVTSYLPAGNREA